MFGDFQPFFNAMIWNHPIETTISKWMFQVPGIYILSILGTVGWISEEMFGEIRREYCHWSGQIQKYRHCNVLGKDEQAPSTNIILFER